MLQSIQEVAMALFELKTSEDFQQKVLKRRGLAMVVFPGADSLLTGFIQKQCDIISSWRPAVKVFSYEPSSGIDSNETDSTLIAIYSDGDFISATSKYFFAEHIDAWLNASITSYSDILEEDNKAE